MMVRLTRVFGLIGASLTGFLLIGFWLPNTWSAESTVEIPVVPEAVFLLLNDLSRWEEWTPWGDIESEVTAPAFGIDARRTWDDEQMGSGSVTITESRRPHLIRYHVEMEGNTQINGKLELVAVTDGSLVTWQENGDFGWNPLMGYVARGMAESQGEQLTASLTRLKEIATSSDSTAHERGSNPG